jgi:hypothetical protein
MTDLDTENGVVTSTNTRSDESIAFAINHFKICRSQHDECNMTRDVDWLPTRLIDVGEGPLNTDSIRLVLAKDLERPTAYCTLSHCWGTTKLLNLTQVNITSFLSEIQAQDLPNTFRDSLVVARKLGIRYIWIDSLCIVQDDPDDWMNEASHMHQVYANSLCNICATGARDSSGGLFHDRDPGQLRTCDVTIPWVAEGGRFRLYNLNMWTREVLEAPLNTRAWVVQEYMLSPRQLHFGSKQILWECLQTSAAEQFPKGLPHPIPNRHYSTRRLLHNIQMIDEKSKDADLAAKTFLHSRWSSIVQRYMQCRLSHASDKVIAFSGIARRFESVMGDECLAGLWRKNIENSLLWHVEYCRQAGDGAPSTRPSPYRAPSFSWMSVEGAVDMSNYQSPLDDPEGQLIRVLDVDIKESRGTIAPGSSIRLECSLRQLKLRRSVSPSGVHWLPRYRQGKIELGYALTLADGALMDVDRDYGDGVYYCLPAKGVSSTAGAYTEVFIVGIVVQPTGQRAGEFERIGFFQAGGEHRKLLLSLYGDEHTYPCESYDRATGRHVISMV